MKQYIFFLAICVVPLPCVTANAAMRAVTDELNRQVSVPEHPHRIVCLLPSVVDDVYALGAGQDVVAVSDYTKYPREATQKPSIGLPLSPSTESILSFHPDLVLGSADLNRMETLRQLEQRGIPVFMVDPHGMSGIYRSIASLGNALNRSAEATKLLTQLHARELAVRQHARGKTVVHLFVPVWYDPIITVGNRAFITEMIAAAGGQSITDDIAQEWPQVGLETVVARRPEAILLIQGSKVTFESIASRPGWGSIPAIENKRVYYADERMNLPSPAAFDAMEDLAHQLHP